MSAINAAPDYFAEYSVFHGGWQVWERYPGGRYVSLGIVSATDAEDAIRRLTEEDDDDRPEAPGLEEQPILDGCEEVRP